MKGKSRGQVDLRFGNIYWEPEEMAFLNLAVKNKLFDCSDNLADYKEFAREVVLFGRKAKVHQPPLGA